MDLATGGGYYLATAADHVVAHPTTVTGGMGVILNLYNLKDAMAYYNDEAIPVKAGRNTIRRARRTSSLPSPFSLLPSPFSLSLSLLQLTAA
jgi:hypothetical protein